MVYGQIQSRIACFDLPQFALIRSPMKSDGRISQSLDRGAVCAICSIKESQVVER